MIKFQALEPSFQLGGPAIGRMGEGKDDIYETDAKYSGAK
jgi:hypothetical protein